MPVVVFVRHCESEFNADPDTCRVRDCGLTPLGVRQAQALPAHEDAGLVICSPMKRCLQTLDHSGLAAAARQRGSVIVSALCREHMVSACDFFDAEDGARVESAAAVLSRVQEFAALLRHHSARFTKIVVVSHADFIWHLTSQEHGGERFGQWLANGECLTVPIQRIKYIAT